jgi:hypothetical protein
MVKAGVKVKGDKYLRMEEVSSYLCLYLLLVLYGHSAIPLARPPPCLFILFLTFQK